MAQLVLLHAVGLGRSWWNPVVQHLPSSVRTIALDLPGHGEAPVAVEMTLEGMARTVLDQVEGAVHLCGLSVGGMIAQHMIRLAPEQVKSLALLDTACTLSDPVRTAMKARAATIRDKGMPSQINDTLDRWFSPEFRASRPEVMARCEQTLLGNRPEVQAQMWEAIATLETRSWLADISVPTSVVVGQKDPSTPLAAARLIADCISGSRLHVIDDASHLPNIEAPREVARILDATMSLAS